MKFEITASSKEGSKTPWTAQSENLPPIQCAIPPEFMGPGGGYSPEDLFALSLLNCLIAAFKVYCEKAPVTFQEIKGKVTLTLDKIPGDTGFAITQAEVFFDVTGASDADKARKLLDSAIKDCPISNSIKTGKTYHINIS